MTNGGRNVVFGEAADQYEAARPGYPAELVDDVVAYAPTGPALEVGAGTGKATAAFAARGVEVTCVEPDPRMAAVLAAKLPRVRVEVTTFEDYPPGRAFALLYAAQAWHWVDERRRWDLARAALAPGGAVAVFRNHYGIADPAALAALAAVDERHGVSTSSLHREIPARPLPEEHPLAGDPRFTDLDQRRYRHAAHYPAARYLDLVGSVSAYRVLPPEVRAELLAEVGALLGDGVEMTFATDLVLARRAS
ncbi:trans-aconitate 2-methyltransferase [Nonomuraea sp. NPDC050783]|uniref:class I SAM-dependent methyltransferase n=1 Tax=Nonomuraea sp. NPDC050783 TaxID=3154634 RepID=UPI003466DB29